MIAAPLLLAGSVVLWHSYRGAEQKALEQAAAAWNRTHTAAQVTPVAVPDEGFRQKLKAAIPRGHGPDTFIGPHNLVAEWTRERLIAVIDERALGGAAFLDGTLAPLRVLGALYGVPLAFKSPALYYRDDRLGPGGRPPATTDELERTCRDFAATHHEQGAACLVYEAGSFFYHAAWLHGFGGRIMDGAPDAPSARPRLFTPEGVAALSFARRLVVEHVVPDEATGAVVSELFNDGRAAFAISGPWFLGEIRPGVPFHVVPLPVISATGRRATPLVTVEAGFLSAHARHPGEALAFLGWLAGPEGATLRARVGRQAVSCADAWGDPAVAGDDILAAFRAQLADTVPIPSAPSMNAAWEPAQLALRRVTRGAGEPDAELRAADARIQLALRPPPPDAAPGPWIVGCGLLLVGAAALVVRRSRTVVQRSKAGSGSGARVWRWIGPAVGAMVVLTFVPFAVGAALSLGHSDGTGWRFVGLENFTRLLGSRDQPLTDPLSFYFTLAVTALWTVCNLSLHVAIGVALALALRDPALGLRGIYRVLLIVPWAVPNYITALIWKGMFHRQLGAVNGLLGVLGLEPVSWFAQFWTAFTANVVTNVWLGFPFMMVTTLGCLSRIPRDLEEAAALDGAGRWQRLRHVILPLLRPALLPSVVLGAVWTFNMFNVVFLVSGGEPDGASDILISQAYRWAFTRNHQYGYAAAYAVVIFAVLVAQSIAARRLAPAEESG